MRAATTFHSTWKSPAAESLNLRGKRVAALTLSEEEADVEGVVALRPRAWDKSLTADLGTYWGSPRYASFWGPGFWGWGWGWGGAHDGYLRVDTILVVETLVYSLPQGKLVWASQSQTMNPSQVGPFIHELSTKVGTEMEKQGLLGEPALVSALSFQASR
jgi:hypothetical protein